MKKKIVFAFALIAVLVMATAQSTFAQPHHPIHHHHHAPVHHHHHHAPVHHM